MNLEQFREFILETFSANADHPWEKYPEYTVFRHISNRKWFALSMVVPPRFIGLQGEKPVAIVNLKLSPLLIGSLLNEQGFFPAYHMSKENWITVLLDGSVSADRLKLLVTMSYDATAPKRKKKKDSEE